jgi:hypothetical protein
LARTHNQHLPGFYLFYCAGFGVETVHFWRDWLRGEDGWLKNPPPGVACTPEQPESA